MPWLYVSSNNDLLTTTNLKRTFTSYNGASGTGNTMQFILVKYSINGTFLGFETLSNQLQALFFS
jgi:hypothetical protein